MSFNLCVCLTTVRGVNEDRHLFSSPALPPHIGVKRSDISHFKDRSQTAGHVHPFLVPYYMPGEIRSFSAKTPRSAPEHNSRCQISAMEREGMRACWTRHTHTMQRTTRETYLVETGQMFYLSMCVSWVLCSLWQRSVNLWSWNLAAMTAVDRTALINYTIMTMSVCVCLCVHVWGLSLQCAISEVPECDLFLETEIWLGNKKNAFIL